MEQSTVSVRYVGRKPGYLMQAGRVIKPGEVLQFNEEMAENLIALGEFKGADEAYGAPADETDEQATERSPS